MVESIVVAALFGTRRSIVCVHLLDQGLEHRGKMLTLHLAGRRRVALFGVELLRNDPEFLDLFDARQGVVDGADLRFDQPDDLLVRGERREACINDAFAPRPFGNRAKIDLDERADEFAAVADQRRLADIRDCS